MKRSKIIRIVGGLCFIAGGIGYGANGEYLFAGVFAVIAVVMLVSVFAGSRKYAQYRKWLKIPLLHAYWC